MPRATQDTTINYITLPVRDYHPLWSNFPVCSSSVIHRITWSYNPNIAETILVWANPISLATTLGITLVFSSSGYLDVSVHRVRFTGPMYSDQDNPYGLGFPIRKPADRSLFASSPQFIAGYHVLHRL